jgi:hypothetical protein
VRLAAAEVGLQLHHRVAAAGGQALHRADQHPLQAFGQVGAAEELHRVPVFVAALAQMHLPQIGGELGLLVATAGHVDMRHDHFAPGLEVAGDAAFDRRAGRFPLFAARLLVEAHAQQFHLHLVDVVRLRGRNGGQQAPSRIERAVGVVAGEGFLMRPGVAHGHQLIDQAALALAENLAKHLGPFAIHDHQRGGDVLEGFALAGAKAGVGQDVLHFESPAVAILRFQLPLDERQQAGFQKLQRFADALVVGNGHGGVTPIRARFSVVPAAPRQRELHGVPQDVLVDVEIRVHQAIAHADDLRPGYAGKFAAPGFAHLSCGLADNLHCASQRQA